MSVKTYTAVVKRGKIKVPEDIHLPENAKIYIIVADGEDAKFDLKTMASQMPADYKPSEVDWGKPVGKEVW